MKPKLLQRTEERYLIARAGIVFLAFWTASLSALPNLLTNGGFESGGTGWLANGVPGWSYWGESGYHHADAGAYIGSKGMKLWWDDTGMWQDFTATAGTSYHYRVQVMDFGGDTTRNNWDFRIEAEFYTGTQANIIKVVLGTFNSTIEPDNTWVEIGGVIKAPAGTAFGRVVMRLTDWREGIGGAIYFDDVSVTAVQDDTPDYNSDSQVDYVDYGYLSASWQKAAPDYDLNGDGLISLRDLAIFVQDWLSWQVPQGVTAIAIDPAVTYQEIEGFGASLTDSSAWLIYAFLNASERQAVLTDLFDPNDGIGLSYLRQPMGASDFRLQEYSYDDLPAGISTDYDLNYFSIAYDESYIIPTLQEILAVNPNVRIMGSPWSPPTWMKDSGQVGWGSLKSTVYDTYANYFVKYIQAYAAHGITVDAVSPQNEPGLQPGDYGGCYMTAADQIKLIKKMGAAFAAHNVSTKILAWDFNWDNPDYPLAVLADPTARSYIAGTAFHHYAGHVSTQTMVHEAWPDKGIYHTEASDGTWNDGGFNADLMRNGIFVVETLRSWAKTIVKWNLALDENNGPKIAGGCSTCYGVITINQSNRLVLRRPHYYALGHASKFLRPGARRIASESGSVQTVAFKNTDGSVVLYVVNPNSWKTNLKLECRNQWVVSEIPARSMMTFRWDNVPNARADVYLTTGDQTSLLKQQTPVYFHD